MKYIKLKNRQRGSILINLLILLMINVLIMIFTLRYMYNIKNRYINKIDENRKYIDISCVTDQITHMLSEEITQLKIEDDSISYFHNKKRYIINKGDKGLRYIVNNDDKHYVLMSRYIDQCKFNYEPSEKLLYIYLKSKSGEENFCCIKIKKEALL
ncbi:hypothetical protein KQI30_00240 [Clostridium bornimense]|uniref:hypothetical protein n=1 Tax=Clostridium bornimense TaxID=1216932 RepID=UPI001C107468|nr:hypothetical protein [Clostridium bornimense]MBU5314709.1 hypothetical protein [Clostridium bornimense]